jgi:uncharacterized repeat protein (TIGR01451 family)
MRRLLSFAIVLCAATSIALAQSGGESWIPVGDNPPGITGQIRCALVKGNGLYVLYLGEQIRDSTQWRIAKWDGDTWTLVTTFEEQNELYSFAEYKGEFYVGGYFGSINGVPGTAAIARFDGTSWKPVGGGITGGPLTMKEYNGKLYVGGDIRSADGHPAYGIAAWDGHSWSTLEPGLTVTDPVIAGPYAVVNALEVYKGKLCVGGFFGKANGIDAPGIATWDGHSWGTLGGGTNREVYELGLYDHELYAFGPYITSVDGKPIHELARWDGHRWDSVGVRKSWLNIHDMTAFRGELYAVGWSERSIERWDGSSWQSLSGFNGIIYRAVEFKGELYICGGFTESDGRPVSFIAKLCNERNCGTIAGTIFNDLDGDCDRENGEQGLLGRMVMITPGPYYASTDSSGAYRLHLPTGTYGVDLVPYLHWTSTCQDVGYSITIDHVGQENDGKDFATQAVPNVRDLRASVAGTAVRPGRPVSYTLAYKNVGTIAADGMIRFRHDPGLTYTSSVPPADRITSDVVEWDFTNLAIGESRTISVEGVVSEDLPLNSELCVHEQIMGNNTVDDEVDLCPIVRSSYDPNDMRAMKGAREITADISPNDSVITYMVRFQNTGNDTAFRIVVVDTLDRRLDPATVTPGAASHSYEYTMSGRGVMTWTFENILLPDSNMNEPGSHGYFTYSVRLRPSLAPGATIPSQSHIYFDYNAPVPTNVPVVRIAGVSGVDEERAASGIFPNPTSGILHIRRPLLPGSVIEVRNMLGRTVGTYRSGSDETTLDLSSLPTGAYTVVMRTRGETIGEKITIVR